MDKKIHLSTLFYDLGKQGTDFRITRTFQVGEDIQFTKWVHYLGATDRDIESCNQREMLLNEIIFDLDDKTKDYDELIERLRKDKIKFYAFKTKSNRARHIHTYWNGLSTLNKEDRRKIREYLLEKYGCDLQLSIDNHMIALEYCPHWKSNEVKDLYQSDEGLNMELPKLPKYSVEAVTDDFFIVTNIYGEEKYRVDLAMKTCTCPDFQMKPKKEKKRYRCKHLKMVMGLE